VAQRAGITRGRVKVAELAVVVENVVRYEDIQKAIVVVIDPDRPQTPARVVETGFFGDVREGPVAIVVVEDVAAVVENVQIHVAVVVVIGGRTAGTEHAVAADACLLGYICERAVAIVAVQLVRQLAAKIAAFVAGYVVRPGAVYEVEVHEAVAVVIENAYTAAGALHDVVQVVVAIAVLEVDPRLFCDVGECRKGRCRLGSDADRKNRQGPGGQHCHPRSHGCPPDAPALVLVPSEGSPLNCPPGSIHSMIARRSSSVRGADPAGGMRLVAGTVSMLSHGCAVFLPDMAQTRRLVRARPGSTYLPRSAARANVSGLARRLW